MLTYPMTKRRELIDLEMDNSLTYIKSQKRQLYRETKFQLFDRIMILRPVFGKQNLRLLSFLELCLLFLIHFQAIQLAYCIVNGLTQHLFSIRPRTAKLLG